MTNPKAVAGLADKLIAQGHAEAADKPLIEAFHYRFHPAFQRVMEIVASGELGDIKPRLLRAMEAALP